MAGGPLPRDRYRDMLMSGGVAFAPPGIITSWLRNSAAGGDVASVPDVLNPANPALQSQSARRPTAQADQSLQYTTNDVLVWPLAVQNNGTQFFLWAGWVEHDAAASAQEAYCTIANLTNGASALKFEFLRHSSGQLRALAYTSGANGRMLTTTAAFDGDPMFLTAEFCSTQSGEVNQLVITVDGAVQAGAFSNLGTGASLDLGLVAGVTGNMCIGNRRDGSAASPFNGRMARNQWCGASGAMATVTQGLLTAEARTNLRALEPLT